LRQLRRASYQRGRRCERRAGAALGRRLTFSWRRRAVRYKHMWRRLSAFLPLQILLRAESSPYPLLERRLGGVSASRRAALKMRRPLLPGDWKRRVRRWSRLQPRAFFFLFCCSYSPLRLLCFCMLRYDAICAGARRLMNGRNAARITWRAHAACLLYLTSQLACAWRCAQHLFPSALNGAKRTLYVSSLRSARHVSSARFLSLRGARRARCIRSSARW